MKRTRTLILSLEAAALAGVVGFTVAGALNPRQMIFVLFQAVCGALILVGELAMRRFDLGAE